MIRSVLLAIVMVFTLAPDVVAQNTKPIRIPDPQWKKGDKFKMTSSQRIASMERGLFAYRYSLVRTWRVEVVQGPEEGDIILRLKQTSANSDMNLGTGKNKFRLKKNEWRKIMALVESIKSGFPMVFSYAKHSKMMRLANEAEITQYVKNEISKLSEVKFVHPNVPRGIERHFGTLLEQKLNTAMNITADARYAMGHLMMFRRASMVPKQKYTGITAAIPFLALKQTATISKMQGRDVMIHTFRELSDRDLKGLGNDGLELIKNLRKQYPSKSYEINGRIDMNHVITWKKGYPKAFSERHTLRIFTKTEPKTHVGDLVIREVTVKLQRGG